MTTASTNTTVANTNTTTFDAWVNEIYTNLVTNCGLTQTADTGQMAVPSTSALPGAANTAAGYYIFRFNDTLQATSPVFIKLEFGTGTAVTVPQVWITVGSGSNGSGTINGTVMTRVAVCNNGTPATGTNFVSRYCYNATQGFLGMAFKISGVAANENLGGFYLFRSVNATGNSTADSVMMLTNSSTSTGNTTAGGVMQVLSYNLSAAYLNSGPITGSTNWTFIPFTTTGTLEGTSGNIFPVMQWSGSSSVPGYGMTNALAMGLIAEISVGSTVTVTVIGSVSLTYIAVAGSGSGNIAIAAPGYAINTYSLLMLWQ